MGFSNEIGRSGRAEQYKLSWSSTQPPCGPPFLASRHIFFKGDVKIASAKTKAGDGSTTRMCLIANPRACPGVQIKRTFLKLQRRIWPLYLDRGRQHLVVQCHNRLEKSGRARSSLGVPDLRLHRTQRAPLCV